MASPPEVCHRLDLVREKLSSGRGPRGSSTLSTRSRRISARWLGSDCPFFVKNVPSLVTGRGEHVQPLDFALPLEDWWVVVVNPGIHISTAEAFSGITPNADSVDWAQLTALPVAAWGTLLRNDFEKGAVERHPSIGSCLQALRDHGAAYAQMTGSGSTVYGLFAEESLAQTAALKMGAQHVGALG